MGYDYPECIITYTQCGGNVIANEEYTLCITCVHEKILNNNLFTRRARHYAVNNQINKKFTCDMCDNVCELGYENLPILDGKYYGLKKHEPIEEDTNNIISSICLTCYNDNKQQYKLYKDFDEYSCFDITKEQCNMCKTKDVICLVVMN